MKNQIEIEQVISDLTELFEVTQPTAENASYILGGKFAIDKRKFERLLVIDMLQEYFKDKVIKGGYLIVDSITLIHTTFEVKDGHPNNE